MVYKQAVPRSGGAYVVRMYCHVMKKIACRTYVCLVSSRKGAASFSFWSKYNGGSSMFSASLINPRRLATNLSLFHTSKYLFFFALKTHTCRHTAPVLAPTPYVVHLHSSSIASPPPPLPCARFHRGVPTTLHEDVAGQPPSRLFLVILPGALRPESPRVRPAPALLETRSHFRHPRPPQRGLLGEGDFLFLSMDTCIYSRLLSTL